MPGVFVSGREASRRLWQHPRCRPEDLGQPIPDSPHAVSVALPLWRHVVGYEEGDPEIVAAMSLGYPRFVVHPLVSQLFQACQARFATEEACAFAFPSAAVAHRAAAWVGRRIGAQPRVEAFGDTGVHAIVLPRAGFEAAKRFWQHFGEIVSSRQAEAALEGRCAEPEPEAEAALKARLAGWAGGDAAGVYCYPTGIAALAEGHRMVQALAPGHKSVQVGFPYVDVLKIQTETDPGVHFFPRADVEAVNEVAALLERETVSGILCEFAGNPLLTNVDVRALSQLARAHGLPFIIDDTLGTYRNVDLLPHCDAVVTSLTKYISGVSDTTGGAMVLNPASRFFQPFTDYLAAHHEALLWPEDLALIEQYSRDFPERMDIINANAEALCDWLRVQTEVETVYYPKFTTPEPYRAVMKEEGGYGGLFSLLLKDPAAHTESFYDRLRVSKGPSLGTDFTLACPYTLLAHYGELEDVEAHGVSRWLVRVSVGMEEAADLIERFAEALRG